MEISIGAYTLTCAAGAGMADIRTAIAERRSGLRPNDLAPSDLPTWIGRCDVADHWHWDGDDNAWRSRNNALAAAALQRDEFAARAKALADQLEPGRVGTIIGTSTSSIGETEVAYRELSDNAVPARFRLPRVHNPHSTTDFVAHTLGLTGPQMTISTACSSSAKVFAAGARWLRQGLVDAVVVGGVDSLCLSVLHGFHSLELTSEDCCRPFDVRRNGISIGEAAGFALLYGPGLAAERGRHGLLAGFGESSDAHHMSHPHPEGLGATLAMEQALAGAGIEAGDVDHINLHGTASQANDRIEAMALAKLFPSHVHAASTKAWTGHTLGAAGVVEGLLALDTLTTGALPGTLNLERDDPEVSFPIARDTVEGTPRWVMNNSFGFGGNNCSLLFARSS